MAAAKKTTKTADKKAAETVNPFAGFEAFTKAFSEKPAFDVQGAVDFQRKNVEAVIAANRAVFEGFKTVAQKQADLTKKALEEVQEFSTNGVAFDKPEALVSGGFERAQDAAKTAFSNAKEVSDIAVEANQKAVAILQERYQESVVEFKDAFAN